MKLVYRNNDWLNIIKPYGTFSQGEKKKVIPVLAQFKFQNIHLIKNPS